MEKWKIGAIIALMVGFGAFQWFATSSENSENVVAAVDGEASADGQSPARPVETPSPALLALKGKMPHAWGVPANLWLNTPKPITLADLKGSVAVIEFWRLQCSHCQEAVPFMNGLHQRYKSRGLKVVTFQSPGELTKENMENNWGKVQEFAQRTSISYPVAFDTERKVKDKYKIELYPMILVLDRDGRIQLAETGHTPEKEREIVATIERLLKQK